jgi:hypothetical protein
MNQPVPERLSHVITVGERHGRRRRVIRVVLDPAVVPHHEDGPEKRKAFHPAHHHLPEVRIVIPGRAELVRVGNRGKRQVRGLESPCDLLLYDRCESLRGTLAALDRYLAPRKRQPSHHADCGEPGEGQGEELALGESGNQVRT